MGRWHAHALGRAGGQLVAVVDPDAARAASVAGPLAAAATSLDEALRSHPADVVHLCTPLESHAALARQALEDGRHVLVEKPLAPTAADTEALLALAAARRLLVAPVHQFVFQQGVQRIVAALPRIGPLVHVEALACSAGAEGGDDARRDAVAMDVLPHGLSLVRRLLGIPMTTARWELTRPAPGELRATTVLGGASVALLVSMAGRPTRNALTVIGARGSAHADLFHGFAVVEGGAVSRAHKIVQPFAASTRTLGAAVANLAARTLRREPAYPGLRELVRRFYAAVRGEAPPPYTRDEIVEVASVRDGFMEIVARGDQMPPSGAAR